MTTFRDYGLKYLSEALSEEGLYGDSEAGMYAGGAPAVGDVENSW